MRRLSVLLWVDNQFPTRDKHTIAPILGDKYLLSLNPICSRIRDLVISLGGTFSSDATPAWRDYQSAPLFCLQQILESGTIPYISNGETLERIILIAPDVEVSDRILPKLVQKNVVLHESSHLCADRIMSQLSATRGRPLSFVAQSLIAESFANMIEQCAAAFVNCGMHRLFFSMNSYISHSAAKAEIIRSSIALVGIRDVIRLGIINYLFLNSHESSISTQFAHQLIELTLSHHKLSRGENQLLKVLVETTFTLNYGFRADTTPLFFSLHSALEEFKNFAEHFTNPYDLDNEILLTIDTLVDSVFLIDLRNQCETMLNR